ncbi:MAG: acetate--CoA ligase family protein [Candidatus Hodarchaeales archaeon]
MQENKPFPEIKYLFEPRSVAIIGASSNSQKIGFKVVDNIVASGYSGKIYPVNPKGGEILGCNVYKSIEAIDGDIDLATICVPAKYVFDVIRDCALKNTKFISIITSGFSEIGNIEEEQQIVDFANKNGMRVLGPNIFGIYSAKSPINATFGNKHITDGSVAIVTQSGALGVAMIGKTDTEGIGLSAIVSVGNKSDVDEADLIEYFITDEKTKVILLYIEGLKDGDKLTEVLRKATRIKPVIIIKSGRSKRGAMAAASHTGSLAGADNVFDDIVARQVGALRALSVQEALNWAKFLAIQDQLPKGENTVIVTNGGGIGVLATDACELYGVKLYDNHEVLKEIFDPVTPSFGSTKNPVDITGGASSVFYKQALQAALDSPDIHSVIVLGCETAIFTADELNTVVQEKYVDNRPTKPVVFSFFGGKKFEQGLFSLKSQGVPIFPDVYEASSCLGALYKHYHNIIYADDLMEEHEDLQIDVKAIQEVIDRVRNDDDRRFLLVPEALEVMDAAGIPTPKSYVAKTLEEAIHYAEEVIKYPVVMKIVSKDIIHKSDAGGVALNIENRNELINAYEAILASARKYKPDALITGIEVVTMINMSEAMETIIGARIDDAFGPTVMFGLGGIYVEVLKDVAFRAVPITRSEAFEMIKQIRSYPLLLGVRGEEPKDIEGCVDVLLRLSKIIQSCPDISDIEINPVLAFEQTKGILAVDTRILLNPPKNEGS